MEIGPIHELVLLAGIHGLVTVTQSPFPWALKRPVESVYWQGEFASNWHLETPDCFTVSPPDL